MSNGELRSFYKSPGQYTAHSGEKFPRQNLTLREKGTEVAGLEVKMADLPKDNLGKFGIYIVKGDRISMGVFKHIVLRGIYYQDIGIRDYATWSQKMVDEFGSDIRLTMRHIRKWSLLLPNMMNYSIESKLHCWEFMGCRLQMNRDLPGAAEITPCPVHSEERLKSLHDGQNAGRACWLVLPTLCGNTPKETAEQKRETCLCCDFYALVIDEEDDNRTISLNP